MTFLGVNRLATMNFFEIQEKVESEKFLGCVVSICGGGIENKFIFSVVPGSIHHVPVQ